ncbi:PAS domain-containing protein [Vibrio sp. SS-MA-C1-2]|uniref:helix-turn-helix transcriptional regulator n=1 Tax=Vibrio sp. SS-MA-C1-2 TaxID=2908646 RepID=UPI001F36ED09|nr:PAS domain-containing protein [Vibrio sp. SS-MA-C1-2]UJF17955.1 PAS domain-containing protein [Vibrio sp. SS-MA-C1-2]
MKETKFSVFNGTFTEQDKLSLATHFRVAETMAELIGPHCEIVIHSFESLERSVVKIVNGHHTGRKVGSPITDVGLKMLSQIESTGEMSLNSYFTHTKDGRLLKSTTCMLTDVAGKPIGLFCVNINLSHPFPEIMKTLMPDSSTTTVTINENFSSSTTEIIKHALEQAVEEVDNDPTVTIKGRKKTITQILFQNGIFELKESTAMVSAHLGITRHAIYKYIREFKSELIT